MKNFFFLALALLLCTACQNKPQRYFADSAETETLKAGIKAYEAGDWDTWKSHFADTAKVFVNSIKPVSIEERLNTLKSMAGAMSSYGFNHDKEYVEMVLDKEDETWVYYWSAHKGTFAATNTELIIPVHLAVQFVDGKIVEEHIYYDGTAMAAELEKIAAAATEEASESSEE